MTIQVTEINECRVCKSGELLTVLDFGSLHLTGVFKNKVEDVESAPLVLVECVKCKLVQLRHNYPQAALYGETYGYESHLNDSMVSHLTSKARILESKYLDESKSNIVVDIASNDGTLLAGYVSTRNRYVGIDPLISIVDDRYPVNATKIQSFFSSESYFQRQSDGADLVTSLSVLYDLDDPIEFAQEVASILREDGIWHFEQSYLPSMCNTLSYDTVCHEHVLYLKLHDIMKILNQSGFKIIDAGLNDTNGGSIAITAIKTVAEIAPSPYVNFLLEKEDKEGYLDGSKMLEFASAAQEHRNQLEDLIRSYARAGYDIYGLGASTKGNVLLQWGNLTSDLIIGIGDINKKKFGKVTPGTAIPIRSEEEMISFSSSKALYLVLPWHFRAGILKNCSKVLELGGAFLFPLPRIEVVSI